MPINDELHVLNLPAERSLPIKPRMREFGEIQSLSQQAPELPPGNAGQHEQEVEDYGKSQSAKDANWIFLVKIVAGSEALTAAYDQGQAGRIDRCSGRGDHNRDPPVAHCIGERIAALEDARPTSDSCITLGQNRLAIPFGNNLAPEHSSARL
jgi:hypothetical protein